MRPGAPGRQDRRSCKYVQGGPISRRSWARVCVSVSMICLCSAASTTCVEVALAGGAQLPDLDTCL